MKRFAIILLAAILTLFASTGRLFALGTSYNTAIINGTDSGAVNVADTYGDVVAEYYGGGAVFYSTPGTDAIVYVAQVSGCTVYQDTPDSWGSPGDTVSYQFRLVNRGNGSDSFALIALWDSGNNWTGADTFSGVDVYPSADSDPFNWGYPSFFSLGDTVSPLAEDAMSTFYFNIHIPTTAVGGETSAWVLKFLPKKKTSVTDTEGYSGFNGTAYGGYPESSLTYYVLTTCQAYSLSLNKTVDVQAPAGYNGAPTDPVPGAKLTYTIYYDNDGSAIDTFIIYEYIPQYTKFDTATPLMASDSPVIVEFSADGTVWDTTWADTYTRIRWRFVNPLAANNGDLANQVDGPIPDVDAGTVAFTVIIQ